MEIKNQLGTDVQSSILNPTHLYTQINQYLRKTQHFKPHPFILPDSWKWDTVIYIDIYNILNIYYLLTFHIHCQDTIFHLLVGSFKKGIRSEKNG